MRVLVVAAIIGEHRCELRFCSFVHHFHPFNVNCESFKKNKAENDLKAVLPSRINSNCKISKETDFLL